MMGEKFYQYTIIDEASRERFIYPYKEQSSYSTVDCVKHAIVYFGYKPITIQTDNGSEFFTYTQKTDKIHPLDVLLNELDNKLLTFMHQQLVKLNVVTEMIKIDFIII